MAFQRQLLSCHTTISTIRRITHLSSSVRASIDSFASPSSQIHTVYRVGLRYHSQLPHLQNSPRLAGALKDFRKDREPFSTSSEQSAAKDPLLKFKPKDEEMGKSKNVLPSAVHPCSSWKTWNQSIPHTEQSRPELKKTAIMVRCGHASSHFCCTLPTFREGTLIWCLLGMLWQYSCLQS